MRATVLPALVVTGALVLTGCTLGQASTFRGRSNDACAGLSRTVSHFGAPGDGHAALKYAVDRYQNMDRLVSQIGEDLSLPGGATGRELDRGWLDPARASLVQGRSDLVSLRNAVEAGTTGTELQDRFDAAVVAGTAGVDTGLLRDQQLTSCAAAFARPSAPVIG